MKLPCALFLSYLFLAAIPAPPDEAFAVKSFLRGDHGYLRIDNMPTAHGMVDVVTPWDDNWCVARLDDASWSTPIPLSALGGDKISAEVSVTFCVSFPIVAPYGSVVGATEPVQYTVSAGAPGDNQSLEDDVQEVKDLIAGIGGFTVACP
jgi:hypothetical protein